MIFVIKDNFFKQLKVLVKKYKLIEQDFEDFKNNFNLSDWKHLWKWIYKFRMKNSSINSWKSWGFRIILLVKITDLKVMPFIIYSKTDKESISINEIIKELEKYI